MRDIITVIVRPATRREREQRPKGLTAFIDGLSVETGAGNTVLEAIEDLFTSAKTARYCSPLNTAIAELVEPS